MYVDIQSALSDESRDERRALIGLGGVAEGCLLYSCSNYVDLERNLWRWAEYRYMNFHTHTQ